MRTTFLRAISTSFLLVLAFVSVQPARAALGGGGVFVPGGGGAASGAMTNYPELNTFKATRPLDKMAKDDIDGMVSEITSRGYYSNLVDVWAFQPRWGTNQTSYFGVPYWQNCSPQNLTNLQSAGGVYSTNSLVLTLSRPVQAFTIAVVCQNSAAYLHNPSTTQPASQRTTLFSLENTNDNSCVGWRFGDTGTAFVYMSQNGIFPVSYITNANQWQSNEVLQARSATSSANLWNENHFHNKRTTWILSFDGTNQYRAWENGNPCAFPKNNSSSAVTLNYNCPVNVTSVLNQITLGWSQFGRTNLGLLPSYPCEGFAGKIDSVMVFDRFAETNFIDSLGFISGSPLANCAYAASRWLEPSTTELIVDGTSMMNNGSYNGVGTSGNVYSNCVWQAWFNRHPEFPAAQVYSRNGSALAASTNCGGQVSISPLRMPFVGVYQLPAKVTRKIIFTDHPRNDDALSAITASWLFSTYYAPLKAIGCEIWQASLSNGNTNQTASFPNSIANGNPIRFAMATNPVISKFIPLFKYISQGGIVDPNDPTIAIVTLGPSGGAHYEGTNAQYYIEQYINLVEGGQFYPKTWPVYLANSSTWSGYPPVNGYLMPTTSSPYLFTNTVLTSVKFFFSSTSHGGVALNGTGYPAPGTGGEITLLPFETIAITNPVGLNCGYRPLAPSNSYP